MALRKKVGVVNVKQVKYENKPSGKSPTMM
jgi:hypothetical protein